MSSHKFDLAVVGSGFGGSLLATVARRLGRSVLLLERGRHPRFAIGESSTPLANLLLEEMASRYGLPAFGALAKWGTWQKTHPQIACGLKRGFTFVHHVEGERRGGRRDDQLLVAASPHDEIADTHWYRPDFDHFFVEEAQRHGVVYREGVHLTRLQEDDAGVMLQTVDGERFWADFLVDATGPRGFCHRVLGLAEENCSRNYPATQALYSHFTGVHRLPAEHWHDAPFPVDDAAVHHVFDDGWMWILRFNNGITSAGVAYKRGTLPEGEAAWECVLRRLPEVADQFRDAVRTLPFAFVPHLSFRSAQISGKRWAMLPSAAGFVDPLFSTGFPMTLLGIERLVSAMQCGWDSRLLADYARDTQEDLEAAGKLIGALYGTMDRFDVFTDVSMLYFAAASYSETCRRLGAKHLASSFLLRSDDRFGPAASQLLTRAAIVRSAADRERFSESVRQAIEPINIAGLCDGAKRGWYPVNAEDLLSAADKVRSTPSMVGDMLQRSGFWQSEVLSA